MYPYSTSQVALPSQFALPSTSQAALPSPSQAALPTPSQAALLSPSQLAVSSPSQPSHTPAVLEKSIPKIGEFLQNLDNEHGEGKFTCFLDSFLSESIDVLDILEFNDGDFIKLGVNSVGIRKKLVRSAKIYA